MIVVHGVELDDLGRDLVGVALERRRREDAARMDEAVLPELLDEPFVEAEGVGEWCGHGAHARHAGRSRLHYAGGGFRYAFDMGAAYQHPLPDDDASFAFSSVDLERFPFFWHVHSEYELTLIRSGRGRRHVGDHVGAFAGDLVLVGPELPHSWLSTSRPDDAPAERSAAVVVQFRAGFLGDAFLKRRELRAVRELLAAAAGGGLAFPSPLGAQTRRLLPAMAEQDGLGRLLGLLQALSELARARPSATALASAGFHPRADRSAQRGMAAVCGRFRELKSASRASTAPPSPIQQSRAADRSPRQCSCGCPGSWSGCRW
jgi:hypothetical protein